MNRPTLFLTKCAGGCGAAGKLTQCTETGQWYCVNCLWRKNCSRSGKCGGEPTESIQETSRSSCSSVDSHRASKRERKLNAKRDKDRKSGSQLHGRKKGTSGVYTVGGHWTWEGDDGTPTLAAIDKGDPNYVSDEDSQYLADEHAQFENGYHNTYEEGRQHSQEESDSDMSYRHTFACGESKGPPKPKRGPMLRRSVSFADSCGGFLEQIIHTCTPNSPAKDDIDVGTNRMAAQFSDSSPLTLQSPEASSRPKLPGQNSGSSPTLHSLSPSLQSLGSLKSPVSAPLPLLTPTLARESACPALQAPSLNSGPLQLKAPGAPQLQLPGSNAPPVPPVETFSAPLSAHPLASATTPRPGVAGSTPHPGLSVVGVQLTSGSATPRPGLIGSAAHAALATLASPQPCAVGVDCPMDLS